MRNVGRGIALVCLTICAPLALAEECRLRIEPDGSPPAAEVKPPPLSAAATPLLPEFRWISLEGEIVPTEGDVAPPWSGRVVFDYSKQHWKVVDAPLKDFQPKVTPIPQGQRVELTIPLTEARTPFQITTVGATGVVEVHKWALTLEPSTWARLKDRPKQLVLRRNWNVEAILGYLHRLHLQSALDSISQSEVMGRVAGGWSHLNAKGIPTWTVEGFFYGTLFPVMVEPSFQSTSYRLMGQVYGGYRFQLGRHIEITPLAGYYYSALLARARSDFGYRNVQGLLLFPRIALVFWGRHSIVTTLKYAPVMHGFSFLELSKSGLIELDVQYRLRLHKWVTLVAGGTVTYLAVDRPEGALIKDREIAFSAGWASTL